MVNRLHIYFTLAIWRLSISCWSQFYEQLHFSWTTMLFLASEHCDLGTNSLPLFAHRPLRSLEKFMAHLWQIHKTSKLILTLSFFATLIFPLPQFPICIFCINFQSCLRVSTKRDKWLLYVCVCMYIYVFINGKIN